MKPTLTALLVLIGSMATAAENRPTGDLAKLQGRWETMAGAKRKLAVTLEVDGSRANIRITTPQGKIIKVQGEIKIDEKVQPHSLDWIKFNGYDDQEFPEIPAIYELKGDTFKVCNGGPNNSRPTEFKPGDGVLADLLEFKRVK